MADIAKLAGVSESTVARALKDSPLIAETTRERIRRLADEAGYAVNPVASSLRSRQTGVITVAVPLVHERETHPVDPFMMTMLAHLAEALSDRGADFDGVMAASDVIAISATRALSESGRRVPQDVSIVGFDDILLAEHAHPPLTTLRQELAQGAITLADTVIAAIRGENPQLTTLAPSLIVRASA